jgi:hypothetical protein
MATGRVVEPLEFVTGGIETKLDPGETAVAVARVPPTAFASRDATGAAAAGAAPATAEKKQTHTIPCLTMTSKRVGALQSFVRVSNDPHERLYG